MDANDELLNANHGSDEYVMDKIMGHQKTSHEDIPTQRFDRHCNAYVGTSMGQTETHRSP